MLLNDLSTCSIIFHLISIFKIVYLIVKSDYNKTIWNQKISIKSINHLDVSWNYLNKQNDLETSDIFDKI